ncbi:hypothetical protein AAFQ97_10165 [Proteus terrae]|uniref:hypothetical protein n=1 Tax=Proteus terrae TaxID=1574161 RepID=UPI00315B0E67
MAKFFISFLIITFSTGVFAYENYYDKELSHMASELKVMIINADKNISHHDSVKMRGDLLNLSKKLHRLEEEAMMVSISIANKGNPFPIELEYAQTISKSIDLSADLLGAYLRTGNKKFLDLSKEQSEFSRAIMADQ